jgi:plasmid stabilization system protein ParE
MVIWTKPARDDLKSIYDFIAADSIFYAERVVEDIILRTVEISGKDVSVLAIIHGSRDFEKVQR